MASLLIEIQTEELPPKALDNLSKAFAKELTFSLKEQDLALPNAQVTAYGSPRRIAALISDVSEVAPDKPFRQKLVPVKEYIDKVFTAGTGRLYASDGRHREAPTEGYGTGGLLQGKKHMLSLTWNAPIEAFTRPGDFFEGRGVDGVYLHFRKVNEFLGMATLPTFICTDVMKNPQVPQYLTAYTAHLKQVFGPA